MKLGHRGSGFGLRASGLGLRPARRGDPSSPLRSRLSYLSFLLIIATAIVSPGPGSARASEDAGPEARSPKPEAQTQPDAQARQEKFTYLLRTYPQRPPAVTLAQTAALIEEGPFAERDRAEFWLGSAKLALGERPAAREWFARLARDYPDSTWVQRSLLGLAQAAAVERDYRASLDYYARAQASRDPAVRELARIAVPQIEVQVRRQRLGWLCGALLALGLLALLLASLRAGWSRAETALRALAPAREARLLFPLLAVLALASLRQDPAARGAALELCAVGASLVWLSGAFLRGRAMRLPMRALYACAMLLLLGCGSYLAIWRNDLVGMVQETWRAGPD